MTVSREASAYPVFFHRVLLAFVEVRRTGVEGDGSSKVSFKTITTALADGPCDNDENDNESNDTNKGKDASLQGRILQE